jgi:hypothetical protein
MMRQFAFSLIRLAYAIHPLQLIARHPALFAASQLLALLCACLWLGASVKRQQLRLLTDEEGKPGLEAYTLERYRAAYRVQQERLR